MSANPAVTLKFNKDLNGIELSFENKPEDSVLAELKTHKFRWHKMKKVWYAKDTEITRAFADSLLDSLGGKILSDSDDAHLTAHPDKEQKKEENLSAKSPSVNHKSVPNTFAEYYENVSHNIRIADNGHDLGFGEMRNVYLKEENMFYWMVNNYHDIALYITDLENAQKTGKTCTKYFISTNSNEDLALLNLLHRSGLTTVSDLCRALKEKEKLPDEIKIIESELRGVDVFSPFIEVKPLKEIPEKWTRKNFVQALMSGQIYKGEVSYHYTDDYGYDAALNFRKGMGINLAGLCMDAVEGWGSTVSVTGSILDDGDKNKAILHYSEHSNSSDTLYFDLSFDHKKGHEYRENETQAIKRFNESMINSCIKPSPDLIDPGKIYEIQTVDMNSNNGVYDARCETMQGYFLKEHLTEKDSFLYDYLLSFQEMELVPEKFYTVSEGHQDWFITDPRIIQADPHSYVVSGKALMELSAEGKYVSDIREDYNIGSSREKLLEHINSFESGRHMYMFTNKKVDYSRSKEQLEYEYERAKGGKHKGIDALIQDAKERRKTQVSKDNVVQSPER